MSKELEILEKHVNALSEKYPNEFITWEDVKKEQPYIIDFWVGLLNEALAEERARTKPLVEALEEIRIEMAKGSDHSLICSMFENKVIPFL